MFRGESGGRRRGSSFNPEFAPLWPGYTARRGREEENEQITQDEAGARVPKLCSGYTARRGRENSPWSFLSFSFSQFHFESFSKFQLVREAPH